MKVSVVILAAGKGTRMRSEQAKVLHEIAGKPMLQHVIETAQKLGNPEIVVVYGHGGEQVKDRLAHLKVTWVEQKEQLGTGHAVDQALPQLGKDSQVLVLYGDVPLIQIDTLHALAEAAHDGVALLTAFLEDPRGYGRIVRDEHDSVKRIVEQKDASAAELEINEINTGFLCTSAGKLGKWLSRVGNNNSQGEYYLTDIVGLAVEDGVSVHAIHPVTPEETMGVNDRCQLAYLERVYQENQAEDCLLKGLTLLDPSRFDVRGDFSFGKDVIIDINCILEGNVRMGSRVKIGANVVIKNSIIDDDVEILPNSVIENATIGKFCRVGPFARIRPETQLNDHVHIGNFVEVKKSKINAGSKVNHLSYIGDSLVGKSVNIGAGTITCNYDGANKHQTIIGDNVFVGSDTQLVAPVVVGEGATIGAGTTITDNVASGELAISRVKQKSITGWKRPQKKK